MLMDNKQDLFYSARTIRTRISRETIIDCPGRAELEANAIGMLTKGKSYLQQDIQQIRFSNQYLAGNVRYLPNANALSIIYLRSLFIICVIFFQTLLAPNHLYAQRVKKRVYRSAQKVPLSQINKLAAAVTDQIFTIKYGHNNAIIFNLKSGTYSLKFNDQVYISKAYAVAELEGIVNQGSALTVQTGKHDKPKTKARGSTAIDSRTFTSHTYKMEPFKNNFGTGKLYTFIHTEEKANKMDKSSIQIEQLFYVFKNKDYFITELKVRSGDRKFTGSRYLAPLLTTDFQLNQKGDNRALFVPYDNDMWARYDAAKLQKADFTSSEVSVFYNNDNNNGIVIGSLEHDVWKSGIQARGAASDKLSSLSMYGGYADSLVTHDHLQHGKVLARNGVCTSPKFMVGHFEDWRKGMNLFGQFNMIADPRYVFKWNHASPIVWNSWGVIQTKINLQKAKAVVDYFADTLKTFRNADHTLFIDLDSFWDNMISGGLDGDVSKLREFVTYCKSKGFKPGVYWAPFVDWGRYQRPIEGSKYNYESTWTRQNGETINTDGGRAMDPTHPGTQERISYTLTRLKKLGFQMIKIDFLGHGAVEGDHFYDPKVTTGMQAYREGMTYVDSVLDGQMLIYAAISPNLATARYVHMRRIACDAFSSIDNIEYTLNSTSYGWWQNQMYDYIDADHVVFGNEPENINRARLTSSIITGTLTTGDDYGSNGQWKQVAQKLLQNKEVLKVAKFAEAFKPVEANTGNKAVNIFTHVLGGIKYVAVFNYASGSSNFQIPLVKLGLPKNKQLRFRDIYSGKQYLIKEGYLNVQFDKPDAVLLKLIN